MAVNKQSSLYVVLISMTLCGNASIYLFIRQAANLQLYSIVYFKDSLSIKWFFLLKMFSQDVVLSMLCRVVGQSSTAGQWGAEGVVQPDMQESRSARRGGGRPAGQTGVHTQRSTLVWHRACIQQGNAAHVRNTLQVINSIKLITRCSYCNSPVPVNTSLQQYSSSEDV